MEPSPIDDLLSEDQSMIASAVAEFARDSVAPRQEALDHQAAHSEELWAELAGLGLFGILVPEQRGGAGAGCLAHAAAVEALARGAGVAGAMVVAQGLLVDALLRSGAEALQDEHLEGLVNGELLGAPALFEDDPTIVGTTAKDGGDEPLRVSGIKRLVPFPGRAGLFLVRARRGAEDSLVLVRAGETGILHGAAELNLGLLAFETGTLALNGAPGVVLGSATLLDEVLAGARIAVSALLAGIARGAIEQAARYAGERKQFGLELRSFGALQERLARCDARVEAVRGLAFLAARARDAGQPHARAASRARLLAAELIPGIADEMLQIYGGYGFSREYPAERSYRDSCFPGFGEHHAAQEYAELARNLA